MTRLDLTTVRYWQESDSRRAQRFYILMCLALSAIHDRFFGVELQQRRNYNWSATVSYYSLVHTGRFLCLQCFGNFPCGHTQLAKVFRGTGEIRFDWLRKRLDPSAPSIELVDNPRQLLVGHLSRTLAISGIETTLDRFARILDLAKELRNDSNYEALLIAHQRHHVSVTPSVIDLAHHMASSAREATELLRTALQAELQTSPDIPDARRAAFRTMAFDYVHMNALTLIEPALYEGVKEKLRNYLYNVEVRLEGRRDRYDDLEEYILMPQYGGLFDTKSRLMESYRRKVDELAQLFRG